jgi:hypothetical protein
MKQQRTLIVLVVLLALAGLVWFRYFRSDNPVLTPDAGSGSPNYQLLSVENPQLHNDRMAAARKTEYKSTGRNIFTALAIPPAAGPQAVKKREPFGPKQEVLPPPPPPPTLPVKFFGYGTVPNGTSRRAFFTDGEDVYVVAEGELLLNRFRILKVGNASLEFEEISSGRKGTAPLEEQAGAPAA